MEKPAMAEDKRLFSFMRTPERTKKPRTTGLTMVEGDYMCAVAGMNWLQDLVEWGGQWIDYFKVGHPMMFQPRELVLKKLALLKQHNINPYVGGNTTEAVVSQGHVELFLEELLELGIGVVEVSSTVSALPTAQKVEVIRKARGYGFTVFAEVGKKLIGAGGPKARMATSGVIREMKACLDAGAFKVVYEHTEIEELAREGSSVESLLEVAAQIGADNIMFEVPIDQHRVVSVYGGLYIRHFGPNVNIGDVVPSQLVHLESQRAGYSSRTFGRWS